MRRVSWSSVTNPKRWSLRKRHEQRRPSLDEPAAPSTSSSTVGGGTDYFAASSMQTLKAQRRPLNSRGSLRQRSFEPLDRAPDDDIDASVASERSWDGGRRSATTPTTLAPGDDCVEELDVPSLDPLPPLDIPDTMPLPELLVRSLQPSSGTTSTALSGKGLHRRRWSSSSSSSGDDPYASDSGELKGLEKQKVAGHRRNLDAAAPRKEPSDGRPRLGTDTERPRDSHPAPLRSNKPFEDGYPPSTPLKDPPSANAGLDDSMDASVEPLIDDSPDNFPVDSRPVNSNESLATVTPATVTTTAAMARERSASTPRPITPSTPVSPMSPEGDPLLYSDDETAPAPPDFTRRGIHIPTRTSSKPAKFKHRARSLSRDHRENGSIHSVDTHDHGSTADSVISYESSSSLLPPLQAKGVPDGLDRLEPVLEDDPKCFDLVNDLDVDGTGRASAYSLEKRADLLFSKAHLEAIFADPALLMRFTSFLSATRPQSVPLLIYYLDALKALRAINYANAVAEALEPLAGYAFSEHPARPTVNSILEEKASQAFEVLVREDLPAYITHVFIQVVSTSIQRRITGTLAPHLREASEGLAEVFCLTDPSRKDNPIIFASEEFHRTTQYGVSYAIGRNCRFLQGTNTNPDSIRRLRNAIQAGKETSELFLNYRRDGSPFMNLLMVAPLHDSRGDLRYFIGAQVDVSGLVKECSDLVALQRIVAKEEAAAIAVEGGVLPTVEEPPKDEFQELAEMLNIAELDTVRRYGGRMHRQQVDEPEDVTSLLHRPRILLRDTSAEKVMMNQSQVRVNEKLTGKLEGVYQNYILIRPYPSLRILFTSPSLRVPGLLQTPFLSRISGSARVKESLASALAEGRGVTAKIRWLANPRFEEEGRPRWIHCTPLLGANGRVGVWMIVLVEDDTENTGPGSAQRRFRTAPPVARDIRRDLRRVNGDGEGGLGVGDELIDAGARPSSSRGYDDEEREERERGRDEWRPKHRPIQTEGRASLPAGLGLTGTTGEKRDGSVAAGAREGREGSSISRPRSSMSRRVGTPVGNGSVNSFAL